MLLALENRLWQQEISAAAQAGQQVLVGLSGHTCAGFTGPIYPEETGRGYFAGIGVLWQQEISAAAQAGQQVLVGLSGHTCAGFTGPIYPEETGRGYFAGIGVAPQYGRHGLGTLLFYRLLEQEQAAGAKYMSLFTGQTNPAKQISNKSIPAPDSERFGPSASCSRSCKLWNTRNTPFSPLALTSATLIYSGAGFREVRTFGVMLKEL